MSETNNFKRLYRSRRDRVIGGVCGGLGGYLGMDPVVLRVIWLAAVLLGGAGVLAYLLAWVLIPDAPVGEDPGKVERTTDGVKIVGIGLIVVSLIWLAARFGADKFLFVSWGWIGPLALVILGLLLLLRPSSNRAPNDMPPEFPGDKMAEEAGQHSSTDHPANGETAKDGPRFTGPTGSLRRSRDDRVILGICGGLAKMWRVDATVVRVVWAAGTLLGAGVLLIAYLVLALVIPEEES